MPQLKLITSERIDDYVLGRQLIAFVSIIANNKYGKLLLKGGSFFCFQFCTQKSDVKVNKKEDLSDKVIEKLYGEFIYFCTNGKE